MGENPKLVKIVEEVKANPMAGMKYMGDPEVSPFISKAMGKLMQKGGGNKQAGGDKTAQKAKSEGGEDAKKGPDIAGKTKGMIDQLMEDPELAKMLEKNPKLVGIVEEVKANPMAGMKYMSDPEVSPFISKAMGKIMGGGMGMPGASGG